MRLPFLKGSYSALDCLFLIVWVRFTLLGYVRAVVMRLPVINSLSEFVIPIVMVTIILLSLNLFVKKLSAFDVFFSLFVICLYLMTYAFYPENSIFLDETIFSFLICSLPYYFVGRVIDYEKVAKPLYELSVISIICMAFLYFANTSGGEVLNEGAGMHYAYQMLPFITIIFCHVFKHKDVLSVLLGIFSIFVLLSFGNRGSVLYLFVFIILGILHSLKSNKKFLIILSLFIVAVLLYIYFDYIILGLYTIMDKLGFSVRIFEKIIEGEIADSSGRDFIVNTLLAELNTRPLGLGLLGDRVVIGTYAHNFFIEIIVSFGYFVGPIICILLFIYLVKAFQKSSRTDNHLFYVATISFGFLPLMTSSSFLIYPNFWLFLGYTISILTNSKLKRA